jgi:predicted Zn finger-like uncharacterized protein
MLVQCPNCHTTYRVSEKAVTAPKPTFRCSRCKNVFALGAKAGRHAAAPAAPAPSAAREEAARELSFTFPAPDSSDKRAEKISPPSQRSQKSNDAAPGNGPALAPHQSSLIVPSKREDNWTIAPDKSADETFAMKSDSSAVEFDPAFEEPFEFRRAPATAGKPGQAADPALAVALSRPLSIAPYLLLAGVMLCFFALVTAVHKAKPAWIESSLKNVPWVGDSVLRNDHLRQGIALEATRPRFQRIQGNREIFLLSGVVVNRNRVKVREVKIEALIFGGDGKVVERQVITVGNAISSKIVRDLTHQEISDLQKQGPVRRFEIVPDESVPYSIVFLKSNPDIKSFAYRVLSAEEI